MFAGKKKFLKKGDIRGVTAPLYDELSVSNLWPMMQQNERFMLYFPDKYAKGRFPTREYFFNVLNTLETEYCQQIIKHANEMRTSVKNEARAQEQVEITDEWWETLQANPFISK